MTKHFEIDQPVQAAGKGSQDRLTAAKPAVYLTNPDEMRRVRMNQPSATRERLQLQRQALHAAAEEFFAEAATRSNK